MIEPVLQFNVIDWLESPRLTLLADLCGESRLVAEARYMRVLSAAVINESKLIDADTADQYAAWQGRTPFIELMAQAELASLSDRRDSEDRRLWALGLNGLPEVAVKPDTSCFKKAQSRRIPRLA